MENFADIENEISKKLKVFLSLTASSPCQKKPQNIHENILQMLVAGCYTDAQDIFYPKQHA